MRGPPRPTPFISGRGPIRPPPPKPTLTVAPKPHAAASTQTFAEQLAEAGTKLKKKDSTVLPSQPPKSFAEQLQDQLAQMKVKSEQKEAAMKVLSEQMEAMKVKKEYEQAMKVKREQKEAQDLLKIAEQLAEQQKTQLLQDVVNFRQNTPKAQARRVWVSFGIFMILLPFQYGYETICLQMANKFCYDIAVSRVQYSIQQARGPTVNFIWPISTTPPKKQLIISYNPQTGLELLRAHEQEATFQFWQSCQINESTIFLAHNKHANGRMFIKDINTGVFKSKMRAEIPYYENAAVSLCLVDGQYIYRTGGASSYMGCAEMRCDRYNIRRDSWQQMKGMNQGRFGHSSCVLAGYIYVFCGNKSDQSNGLKKVEKLSIAADPFKQDQIRWELIPDRNLQDLPLLDFPLAFALNSTEIVILGGKGQSEGKAQIFDTRTDQCSVVAVSGTFSFQRREMGASCIAKCGNNRVVAIVKGGDDKKPYLIKFNKQTSSIKILSKFLQL